MSNLYLDRKNLAVKLDGQALALYEDGVRNGTVPLHLLDPVVMRGNVQLESRLLGALSERNIGLLVLSGLDTMLGFYHDASFGRESLACDLMEPLRPLMDRWV